jgi:hypothetical protein
MTVTQRFLPWIDQSVEVLVNELFKPLIYGNTGLVIEGQDLHENHSRNSLLRIHPEVGVG